MYHLSSPSVLLGNSTALFSVSNLDGGGDVVHDCGQKLTSCGAQLDVNVMQRGVVVVDVWDIIIIIFIYRIRT